MESRIEKRAAGATTRKLTKADVKGKILEFAWQLERQGFHEGTIKQYVYILKHLAFKKGADIFNPESVKDIIARQKAWSEARKKSIISAYTAFSKVFGMAWEPPKCKVIRKLPFIPTEAEIDALIAACGKKTATFLQLLKETAMRAGEANSIEWADIDFHRKVITLNKPEKGCNPRIFKVSLKLINMLAALPKIDSKVFASSVDSRKAAFQQSRKLVAQKLQNPRLLRIHFHTLRHWKATMLYHQTKDIIYVKEFLGHKKIDSTLLYIQIEQAIFKQSDDDFTVKVARTPEEIKTLLEAGFEYICQKDDLMFLRKRA